MDTLNKIWNSEPIKALINIFNGVGIILLSIVMIVMAFVVSPVFIPVAMFLVTVTIIISSLMFVVWGVGWLFRNKTPVVDKPNNCNSNMNYDSEIARLKAEIEALKNN